MSDDAVLAAEILFEYGATLRDLGDHSMAQDVLSMALRALERIGARDWADRVRGQLRSEADPTT